MIAYPVLHKQMHPVWHVHILVFRIDRQASILMIVLYHHPAWPLQVLQKSASWVEVSTQATLQRRPEKVLDQPSHLDRTLSNLLGLLEATQCVLGSQHL